MVWRRVRWTVGVAAGGVPRPYTKMKMKKLKKKRIKQRKM